MSSPAGQLLQRAGEIEFATKAGFTVTLDEISAEEYAALRTIDAERERYQRQKQKELEQQHGAAFPTSRKASSF